MNRLTNTLEKLKNENKKALVAYLVAGDPSIEVTLDLMKMLIDAGVDVIEIGVPFTDPIAEGPIIQKAHDRALKNNISLESIFEMVKDFRVKDENTPLVLMGYLNTFIFNKKLIEENENNVSLESIFEMVKDFRVKDDNTPLVLMGYLNTFIFNKKLIEENENNVIDSILVVDIPGELKLKDYGVYSENINTISLISPTTKKHRIESIAKNSSGFVYYVTLRGVTGASNLDIKEITNNVKEIKKYATVPTLAGFGIKSPEDAKLLSKCSDGVIIGSSIVQMIEEGSDSKEFDRITEYIKEIKLAIS